jgi:hypothetical protein
MQHPDLRFDLLCTQCWRELGRWAMGRGGGRMSLREGGVVALNMDWVVIDSVDIRVTIVKAFAACQGKEH